MRIKSYEEIYNENYLLKIYAVISTATIVVLAVAIFVAA